MATPNPPSLEWVDGVPVVTVMSMGITMHGEFVVEYTETFLSFVDAVYNEPVVIVDLRDNTGGDSLIGSRWLHRLVGEIVPQNLSEVFRLTYEEMMEERRVFEYHDPHGRGFFSLEDYRNYSGMMKLDYSHILTYYTQTNAIVESDRLIILLINNYVASAGEHFVDMILSMGNTLIIGQNTFGVVINRNHLPLALPNSGVVFRPGRAVRVFPEGLFTEGVGLAPDVWVHGDALTAALALIDSNRNE